MSRALFMAVKLVSILVMCIGLVSATLNNNPIFAGAIIGGILAASSWEVRHGN